MSDELRMMNGEPVCRQAGDECYVAFQPIQPLNKSTCLCRQSGHSTNPDVSQYSFKGNHKKRGSKASFIFFIYCVKTSDKGCPCFQRAF